MAISLPTQYELSSGSLECDGPQVWGDAWDNIDQRLADVLESLNSPAETEEMAGPLAVAVGAPLLQPVADTLRTLGAIREQLSLKTADCVATQVGLYRIGKWPIKRHLRTIRHCAESQKLR